MPTERQIKQELADPTKAKTVSEEFLEAEAKGKQAGKNAPAKTASEEETKAEEETQPTDEPDRIERLENSYKNLNDKIALLLEMLQRKEDDPFVTPLTSRPPPAFKKELLTKEAVAEELTPKRSKEWKQQLLKSLHSQIPTYDGTADVVALDNFFMRIEDYLGVAEDMLATDQVIFAAAYLKGTAETWFSYSRKLAPLKDFAELRTALKNRFRAQDSSHAAKIRLTKLKQTASARTFLASFQETCLLIDDL